MSRFLNRQRVALSPEVTALAERLSAAGHKVTRPRLAVLRAATLLNGAFTVQGLEQWLAERGESPGIASIFRAVRLLCELGMLQRIHGLDDCHRYCLSSGHTHHLVCTRCGVVERFDDCGMQEMIAELEQRTGYRVTTHVVELFGLCPQCVAAS